MKNKIQNMVEKFKKFWGNFFIRSVVLLITSVAADLALIIYYCIGLSINFAGGTWYTGQICFYALLSAARVLLLIFFVKTIHKDEEKAHVAAAICTVCFLILLGIEMILLANLIYKNNIPLPGTNIIIFINGSYIIAKMIISLTGGVRYRGTLQRQTTLFCCKKYLSRAEGLFLFYVLYGKLIELYQWKNDYDLILSNYMAGILVGAYTIFLGGLLLYKVIRSLKYCTGDIQD